MEADIGALGERQHLADRQIDFGGVAQAEVLVGGFGHSHRLTSCDFMVNGE
jgi:hypothetical protein